MAIKISCRETGWFRDELDMEFYFEAIFEAELKGR